MGSQNRSIFWWPVKFAVVAEVASLSIHDPHCLREEVFTNDYGSLSCYFPDYLTRYYNPISPSQCTVGESLVRKGVDFFRARFKSTNLYADSSHQRSLSCIITASNKY